MSQETWYFKEVWCEGFQKVFPLLINILKHKELMQIDFLKKKQ